MVPPGESNEKNFAIHPPRSKENPKKPRAPNGPGRKMAPLGPRLGSWIGPVLQLKGQVSSVQLVNGANGAAAIKWAAHRNAETLLVVLSSHATVHLAASGLVTGLPISTMVPACSP